MLQKLGCQLLLIHSCWRCLGGPLCTITLGVFAAAEGEALLLPQSEKGVTPPCRVAALLAPALGEHARCLWARAQAAEDSVSPGMVADLGEGTEAGPGVWNLTHIRPEEGSRRGSIPGGQISQDEGKRNPWEEYGNLSSSMLSLFWRLCVRVQ